MTGRLRTASVLTTGLLAAGLLVSGCGVEAQRQPQPIPADDMPTDLDDRFDPENPSGS